MPHAVLFLGATFLATAAGHISAHGESATSRDLEPTPRILQTSRAEFHNTGETSIVRPASAQRWVF